MAPGFPASHENVHVCAALLGCDAPGIPDSDRQTSRSSADSTGQVSSTSSLSWSVFLVGADSALASTGSSASATGSPVYHREPLLKPQRGCLASTRFSFGTSASAVLRRKRFLGSDPLRPRLRARRVSLPPNLRGGSPRSRTDSSVLLRCGQLPPPRRLWRTSLGVRVRQHPRWCFSSFRRREPSEAFAWAPTILGQEQLTDALELARRILQRGENRRPLLTCQAHDLRPEQESRLEFPLSDPLTIAASSRTTRSPTSTPPNNTAANLSVVSASTLAPVLPVGSSSPHDSSPPSQQGLADISEPREGVLPSRTGAKPVGCSPAGWLLQRPRARLPEFVTTVSPLASLTVSK